MCKYYLFESQSSCRSQLHVVLITLKSSLTNVNELDRLAIVASGQTDTRAAVAATRLAQRMRALSFRGNDDDDDDVVVVVVIAACRLQLLIARHGHETYDPDTRMWQDRFSYLTCPHKRPRSLKWVYLARARHEHLRSYEDPRRCFFCNERERENLSLSLSFAE